MNSPTNSNSYHSDGGACPSASGAAEATLRLIAHLPAPDGLAGRIQAGLGNAPKTARLIAWPASFRPLNGRKHSTWLRSSWTHSGMARGAAAAAIVMVVAGGGWRVYSRVKPPAAARVIVMPARVGNAGGFSTGGAMRTPETLIGPVLKHPPLQPAQRDDSAKPAVAVAASRHRVRSKISKAGKADAPVSDKVTSVPHP